MSDASFYATENNIVNNLAWVDVEDAPKDGTPFLAKVRDWYSREMRYVVLSMNINGYFESAYDGNQTFEVGDIRSVALLEKLPKLTKFANA